MAETNQAYVDSEVNQRIRLVHRQEIDYIESGSRNIGTELGRFEKDGDGHMDEVHTIRTQVGADLLHLIIAKTGGSCGLANVWGPWGVSKYRCGSVVFAHELGHNMALRHDWPPGQAQPNAPSSQASDSDYRNCKYGYVNQKAFEANAPESARWRTIMALGTQCRDHGFDCTHLMRFSNPAQTYGGDPLGRTCKEPGRGEPEPADARGTLNYTAGTVAGWQATVGTPLFLSQIPNSAQTYPKAAAMPPFRLPAASAGTGALTYSLSPALPTGLTFDATTRTISGTPTVAATETTYTYTATDASDPPDTASLTFTLTVVESVQGLCTTDDPAVGDGGSALAADCSTLLGLKDVLRGGSGGTSLNWASDRAMTAWDGLTVSANRVTGLALSGWDLTGSLSTALNSLTGLTSLNLSDNQLTGSIPTLSSLTGLTSLDLSDNQLTGSIPTMSGLSSLTTLNLSDNQLSGSIPALSGLSSLTTLDLSDNQLSGSIPALSGLTGLTTLSLSDNQLTGRIPFQLGQPPLTTLTTFYATTNDTLCLPKALLTWHRNTLTNKDFLISCLSTLTPPYALTFTKGEAIDRLTFNLSGSTLRSWLDQTDNLPQGLTLNNTNSWTIEMWGTPTALQTAATSSFRLEGVGSGRPQVSLVLTTTVEDDIPNFDDISVAAQTYTQGSAVAVTLPTASAGNRPLTYSLSPTLPAGLTFDTATRTHPWHAHHTDRHHALHLYRHGRHRRCHQPHLYDNRTRPENRRRWGRRGRWRPPRPTRQHPGHGHPHRHRQQYAGRDQRPHRPGLLHPHCPPGRPARHRNQRLHRHPRHPHHPGRTHPCPSRYGRHPAQLSGHATRHPRHLPRSRHRHANRQLPADRRPARRLCRQPSARLGSEWYRGAIRLGV